MKNVALALSLIVASSISQALTLKAEDSTLSFISTKNDSVSELMQFENVSGTLDAETGALRVTVTLDSIASGIDIRNERMREHLFEVDKYASASYTASVDMAAVNALKVGEQLDMAVSGSLDLHGVEAPLNVEIKVSKRADGSLWAVSTVPGFVDIRGHKMLAGVDKLRSLAGLNSISLSIPVMFSVVFE